ncbi:MULTISPECIES: hypothetical protein [unclassified Microbacterium]|uniref:hypothetical protein n=1 Tax=unclassified Microbacterium TaxID=2609290 RepID=UPI00301005C9
MISRYSLRCPGCDEAFVARIGVQPTDITRFYFPCPNCQLPIRGRMSGQEPTEHKVVIDGEIVDESDLPTDPLVVTVDPFVPSRYDADSMKMTSETAIGTFPTMTMVHLLGFEGFQAFGEDGGRAHHVVTEFWPPARMLFNYYLQARWDLFERTAKSRFDLDSIGKTAHERATIAYQALGNVTVGIVGSSGDRGEKLIQRYGRKHLAAITKDAHLQLIRSRDAIAGELERDMFGVIEHFIDNYESWAMGRLPRFAEGDAAEELQKLVLFRDEFTLVRDLYQQGFEMACKCLWILVAAQNTVKGADPNMFGDHPSAVPSNKQAGTLAQFDKLPNAYKIAYAAQVPGWDSLPELLNNQRRNTIGHATARHDLRSGRVVSDKDPGGITYLEFLSETFGVFEALSSLMQVVRSVRVTASPDFL